MTHVLDCANVPDATNTSGAVHAVRSSPTHDTYTTGVADAAEMPTPGGLFVRFRRGIGRLNPEPRKFASDNQWTELFTSLDKMTAGVNDFDKVRHRIS
jgi:hypothetical protein